MAKFEIAYELYIKPNEKGYQCWPEDNGNYTGGKVGVGKLVGTKDGITAPEIMAYLGRVPTVEDVKNFPESARIQIFKKKYWDVILGDRIIYQEKANVLCDEQVNAGNAALIEAQEMGGLTVTGKMNEATLNYINSLAL